MIAEPDQEALERAVLGAMGVAPGEQLDPQMAYREALLVEMAGAEKQLQRANDAEERAVGLLEEAQMASGNARNALKRARAAMRRVAEGSI